MRYGYRQQSGFSLIELMVAMVIGLFILLGVVMVYISSLRSQTTSEAVARVQESGRFANLVLSREIRQAGFQSACQGVNSLLKDDSRDTEGVFFDVASGLYGASAADAPAFIRDKVVAGDVLILTNVGQAMEVVVKDMPGSVANGKMPHNMHLDQEYDGLGQETIILAMDDMGCDLFQQIDNSKKNINFGDNNGSQVLPGNDGDKNISHIYDGETDFYTVSSYLYYIGDGIDGRPALKRYDLSQSGGTYTGVDIVNGVDDMRLRYGVDMDSDGRADTDISSYVEAGSVSDWSKVVSVQLNLLVSSLNTGAIDTAQSLNWPPGGTPQTMNDSRLRSVFVTTVGVRNRLP